MGSMRATDFASRRHGDLGLLSFSAEALEQWLKLRLEKDDVRFILEVMGMRLKPD